MPKSVLSARSVLGLLDRPVPRPEFEELLFRSKAELQSWEEDALTIEVTADRLDLLSEGGLALHLQGTLGIARGLPVARVPPESGPVPTLLVSEGTRPQRPFVAALVARAPPGEPVDEGLLAEAIRFQELLHATVGLDRRVASLGIYPWVTPSLPLRYAREPVAEIEFTPLDGATPVKGPEFFRDHPLAQRYGEWGVEGESCLTLRNGAGELLSLPPVLNARGFGEAKVGDSALLLESTGTRWARVEESLGLLSLVLVARGWSVTAVRVEYPDRVDEGQSLVQPRRMVLDPRLVERISGFELPLPQTTELLGQVRLGAEPKEAGVWVEVPPWRPDLRTPVDLVEDVVLAHGVRDSDALLPPSATRGRRLAEHRLRRRVSELLLGLGSSELYTTVLVAESTVQRLGRDSAIALANPVSDQYARLRDSILLSLVESLERNTRRGYPQRFHEVGPVVVREPAAESGASTRYHAGALLASDRAGFADAAALVDYLTLALGARGVREPVELPGTIPGRAARVRLAGEPVAQLGELHPEVLSAIGVPVPAVWAEVDLTALWPLVRRAEAL